MRINQSICVVRGDYKTERTRQRTTFRSDSTADRIRRRPLVVACRTRIHGIRFTKFSSGTELESQSCSNKSGFTPLSKMSFRSFISTYRRRMSDALSVVLVGRDYAIPTLNNSFFDWVADVTRSFFRSDAAPRPRHRRGVLPNCLTKINDSQNKNKREFRVSY